MVAIRPYIQVRNAKKALDEYEKVFGIQIKSRMPMDKEMGMNMGFPEDHDYENSTMHCEFSIDDQMIYMSDIMSPGEPGLQLISILLEIESKEKIEKLYKKATGAGWKVTSKLEKTFWGAWFAQLVDNFGVGWQFNFQEEAYNP